MIVYFNNLGQIKEIINNESIREGNFNVNSIYFYLEETAILSLFEVVWKDRELTTIVNNPKKYNVEIPYNPKADYKYFKEYNTYECYKVDIPTDGVLDSEGLKTASIRIKVQGSDTINTLGIITFLVEQSNVLPTQSISVSQYDYLLTIIGQETKQTVIGVGEEELADGKDVSGRFDNDNFLLSRHGGVLTIAYVSNLTERILFDANLLNNVITLANSTQSALESTQALVNTINTELENLKNTSATKEELGNYYTKGEINELFITKRFHYEIVDTLPTVGESNVLYLVLKEKTTTGNVYTEYIWLEKDKRYEEIGDTGVDLTGYVQGNGLDKDYLIIGNGNSKIIKSSKTLTELLAELNSKVNQATYENLVKAVPTDIDYIDGFTLMHDTTEITDQLNKLKLGANLTYDPATKTINAKGGGGGGISVIELTDINGTITSTQLGEINANPQNFAFKYNGKILLFTKANSTTYQYCNNTTNSSDNSVMTKSTLLTIELSTGVYTIAENVHNVVANSIHPANGGDLTNIQVGSKVYSIPSGGGGGKTLYQHNILIYVTNKFYINLTLITTDAQGYTKIQDFKKYSKASSKSGFGGLNATGFYKEWNDAMRVTCTYPILGVEFDYSTETLFAQTTKFSVTTDSTSGAVTKIYPYEESVSAYYSDFKVSDIVIEI